MKLFNRFFISGFVLVLVAGIALFTWPVLAAPGAQSSDFLPTPTLFPVEDVSYTLDVVGGTPETWTFPAEEIDTFSIGETSVTSLYPQGMIFLVTPESSSGEIQDVILFVRFEHGSGTRVTAEPDADVPGGWVAHPWATGGQPAWTHFQFHWRVRDTSGASVDTTPYWVDYADPNREWFRAESDYVILYWTGFGEDDPDAIAYRMAETIDSIQPRWVAGFGQPISYKPIAVVYPDRDALSNMYGSGVSNNRVAGFTSSELGMSVQVLRSTEIPPGQENCIYLTPPEEWTMERRIETIYQVTGHELTHLYQYDVLGGSLGFEWWFEGQAEWFSNTRRQYDERLRNLASMQDIPSLRTPVGSDLNQADGCYALSYYVGPSFINFLLTNYGGIDLHREIAQRMRYGTSVFDAVEELTGKPFLDIENEWRTYLGYQPLTLADVDPAQALEPYEDNMLAEGDTVTLPATPALVPIYEKPGPKSLAGGQCFANMQVTILKIGALDGVPYYQVDCMGQVGWMTRDQLVGPEQ
jgi:hypothetical protein